MVRRRKRVLILQNYSRDGPLQERLVLQVRGDYTEPSRFRQGDDPSRTSVTMNQTAELPRSCLVSKSGSKAFLGQLSARFKRMTRRRLLPPHPEKLTATSPLTTPL